MNASSLEELRDELERELDRRARAGEPTTPVLALLSTIEARLEGRETPDVPSVTQRQAIYADRGAPRGLHQGA